MKHFIWKRIEKVWFPYVWISLLFVIIIKYFMGIQLAKTDIVLQLIGMNFARTIDGTMWYITFIIILYCAFFMIYKLKVTDFQKLILMIILSLIIFFFDYNYTSEKYMGIIWQFHIHSFSFAIGIIIGYLFKSKNPKVMIKQNLTFITIIYSIIILLIYFLCFNQLENNDIFLMIFSILFGFMALLINFFFDSKLLRFIGKYSYGMYLIEYVFMTYFSPMFGDFENIISIFYLYISILLVSIIITKINKSIFNIFHKNIEYNARRY